MLGESLLHRIDLFTVAEAVLIIVSVNFMNLLSGYFNTTFVQLYGIMLIRAVHEYIWS